MYLMWFLHLIVLYFFIGKWGLPTNATHQHLNHAYEYVSACVYVGHSFLSIVTAGLCSWVVRRMLQRDDVCSWSILNNRELMSQQVKPQFDCCQLVWVCRVFSFCFFFFGQTLPLLLYSLDKILNHKQDSLSGQQHFEHGKFYYWLVCTLINHSPFKTAPTHHSTLLSFDHFTASIHPQRGDPNTFNTFNSATPSSASCPLLSATLSLCSTHQRWRLLKSLYKIRTLLCSAVRWILQW